MSQAILRSRAGVAVALPLILLAILIGVRSGRAHSAAPVPDSYTVTNLNDSGEGSLRQAILDANANPGADIIDFQDELTGTITLTSGELLITDDLTINGPGSFSITVSGNHQSRVFEVNGGITVYISGLTISDGSASNQGGGIFNTGTLKLTNIVLSGNTVGSPGVGGGIYNNGGIVTITDSTLSGNTASTNEGGGIFNNPSGTLTITNSTLSGNSAQGGGGIYNVGTVTITNSTLSGNSAEIGGGIANLGTANISFTTLSVNSASLNGGGIYNFANATLNIKNSIVANSTSGGDCFNNGTFNATGVNFTTNGTCPGFTQVTPEQLKLGPLADNGGPTQTHALLPGSVAIDAAKDCTDLEKPPDKARVSIAAPVTTDQRGIGRPQGAACDAGSYEAVPCTTQPSIFCPKNLSVSTDASQCAARVDYTPPPVNCPCNPGGGGGAKPASPKGASCMASCAPPPGSNFPRGTTDVNCSVTDINNATAMCSFSITVTDQVPPAFSCPAVTKSTDPNQCSTTVNYTVTATDNCDGPRTPSCTPPSGSTFQKGTTTVTCTATDTSNNMGSCSFPVTVNDTQPPQITCPANTSKNADPNQCSTTVTYPAPTASDNCPNVGTPSCSPPSGSTFQKGTTTVVCSVKDASNNMASCPFTVTVNDTQPPQITCPANVTKSNDPNQCGAVVTYPAPTVSDNCPNPGPPTCSPASGSFFPKGTTTVMCSVKDASNNMASCTFTVTVNDTQPPQITCPANVTAVTPAGSPCGVVTYPSPTVSDNCPLPPNAAMCTPPSGSCFARGTTTVTCTATDASGNTASCSFRVTVFDICIQDDSNPTTVVLVNTATGDYRFCCNGTTFTGRGKVTIRGNTYTLEHNAADRRVLVTDDEGVHKASASLQVPPGTMRCTINDRDTRNNTCQCQ